MEQYRLFANNQEIGGSSDRKDAIKMAEDYSKKNECDVQIWLKNIIVRHVNFNAIIVK